MRPLAVDLRSRRPPPRWAWATLAVLVLGAAVSALTAANGQRKLVAQRTEQAALRQHAATPPKLPLPPYQPVMPYDASARVALAQAQAGWAPLLISLEAMEVVGVTPVSIEVSVAQRQVLVDLEFSDFATLLRFVNDINAGEPSPRWQLVQAQGAARAATALGANAVATVVGAW